MNTSLITDKLEGGDLISKYAMRFKYSIQTQVLFWAFSHTQIGWYNTVGQCISLPTKVSHFLIHDPRPYFSVPSRW